MTACLLVPTRACACTYRYLPALHGCRPAAAAVQAGMPASALEVFNAVQTGLLVVAHTGGCAANCTVMVSEVVVGMLLVGPLE